MQRDVVIFVAFAPMCVCKDLTAQACVRWDCHLLWELLSWWIVKAVTSPSSLGFVLSEFCHPEGRKTIGLGTSDPDLGIYFSWGLTQPWTVSQLLSLSFFIPIAKGSTRKAG